MTCENCKEMGKEMERLKLIEKEAIALLKIISDKIITRPSAEKPKDSTPNG